jgi:hypothetical protein
MGDGAGPRVGAGVVPGEGAERIDHGRDAAEGVAGAGDSLVAGAAG